MVAPDARSYKATALFNLTHEAMTIYCIISGSGLSLAANLPQNERPPTESERCWTKRQRDDVKVEAFRPQQLQINPDRDTIARYWIKVEEVNTRRIDRHRQGSGADLRRRASASTSSFASPANETRSGDDKEPAFAAPKGSIESSRRMKRRNRSSRTSWGLRARTPPATKRIFILPVIPPLAFNIVSLAIDALTRY